MSNMKSLFEKELKNKLSLKSSGHTSDETVLLKAFKYFDLDNSGNVSKEEFLKTISKIGITGFTDNNLLELFDLYDEDKSGELEYKEFVGCLYSNSSISKKVSEEKKNLVRPNYSEEARSLITGKPKSSYLMIEGIEEILEKVKTKLCNRGIRGIISIGKAFRIMDDNNSRTLDISEFKKASRDYRWELSDLEVEKAFAAFDRQGNGEVDYEEFLRSIRGNMNSFRRRLVDQAFGTMDKDGNAHLDINDIRGVYNARNHPDVKAGKKTEDEILLEFLETFEVHHNIINDGEGNGLVTREEWQEYYENVSMSIDDDKYFEVMMNNCWRMNENTTSKNNQRGWSSKENEAQKNVSENYSKRKEIVQSSTPSVSLQPKTKNVLLEKFKEKLASRGGRAIIGLARQFKIFDDNNSKTLDLEEFSKAIKDFRIDMSATEIKVLFGTFDRNGDGSIDYEEFLRGVRGEMNEARKKIVCQAFDKLDTDKSGVVEMNEIKYLYNAKTHPEVRSGRKTEEDIYGEFLETFETHHNIGKGPRDRRVTREEFVEYYNHISMSIESDEYFEAMMRSAWKLEGPSTYASKGWAGEYSDKKQNKQEGQSGKVFKSAPFGTTDEPTNYSTSLRPESKAGTFSKKGDDVVLKLREKLASRGTRGIMGIRRTFKICDDDGSHAVNRQEFIKLIKDYRISLNDTEIKKLFDIFDTDKSGEVNYDEFLSGVVGEMNEFRKGLALKAFKKLDKDNSGNVDITDIRGVYNARNHPDVKAGKKTEDEVLAEFLDTFEIHFTFLNEGKSKDRSITSEEFVEYYNQISVSVDDDKYFEQMINTAWGLEAKSTFGRGWKGEI